MRIFYQLKALWRSLFNSDEIDRGLSEELQFHVDRETQANLARGMSHDEAYRAARIKFGSVDDAHERARDDRFGAIARQFGRDVIFGARLLRKSIAFSSAAIGIVAIAIGAVTAIFSVVYGVMLDPLPYAHPERLVSIYSILPTLTLPHAQVAAADFEAWRASNHVFEDIGLTRLNANYNVVGNGSEPERLQAARITANVFPILGASPIIGRNFTVDEENPGNDREVILSNGLWHRRYGGDAGIVGRTIELNGVAHRVVGVMPASFQYPTSSFQIWVPLSIDPAELSRAVTGFNYAAVARLRPGVSIAQAQTEMNTIAKRLAQTNPGTNKEVNFGVASMLDDAVGAVRAPLFVLLAAVGCLLAIACLNLANLLGARAASRSSEFAVRLALGASRGRIALQAIAEVLPILAIGGAVGVVAAVWALRAFVATAPAGLPRVENVTLNATVLVLSFGVLVIGGLFASVAPATQAARADFTAITKESSRSSAGGTRQGSVRRALVVAQIALALPLLAGCGLLVRSFSKLVDVNSGIRAEGVLSALLAVPRAKYSSDAQVAAVETQMLDAMRAIPGVTSVGMVNRLPLSNVGQLGSTEFDVGAKPLQLTTDWRSVSPDYFATIGIRLVRGRLFTMQDDANRPLVGVVDEKVARAAWPGENPIGKRFRIAGTSAWGEVIGVVAHIRNDGLDTDPRGQVYWNYLQRAQDRMAIVVRGNTDPTTLIAPVLQAIRSVDRDQATYDVRTMQAVVDRSLNQRKLTLVLLVVFGVAALALASVGVYGVVAFGVAQRLREFGIRVALGADRSAVTALVVRQGARMAIIGTSVGLVAALLLAGVMRALLFETDARDPVALAGAAAVLVVVAAIASYLPARRAAGVGPAVTLRAE